MFYHVYHIVHHSICRQLTKGHKLIMKIAKSGNCKSGRHASSLFLLIRGDVKIELKDNVSACLGFCYRVINNTLTAQYQLPYFTTEDETQTQQGH